MAEGEAERPCDDRAEEQRRPDDAPHQNPNLTCVKHHSDDVSQSVVSTAASEPPSTGSTQCG